MPTEAPQKIIDPTFRRIHRNGQLLNFGHGRRALSSRVGCIKVIARRWTSRLSEIKFRAIINRTFRLLQLWNDDHRTRGKARNLLGYASEQ